jgi:DDE superfamily endonuclease
VSVCWATVKATLKAAGCRYRRARRVPSKNPSPAVRQARERALDKLRRLETLGKCDVLYGGESGFALCPCLPYAWQAPGHTLRLPAHPQQKRYNVLGFWRRDNWLRHVAWSGRMTGERFIVSVIASVQEQLLPHLRGDRETVLVLDNAPVHRSKKVQAKAREWRQQVAPARFTLVLPAALQPALEPD